VVREQSLPEAPGDAQRGDIDQRGLGVVRR
jgi:hypothetical protein